MPRRKPLSQTDLRHLLARISHAAELQGVAPSTVTGTLFGDFRLPERLARQITTTEHRARMLETHIAGLKAGRNT